MVLFFWEKVMGYWLYVVGYALCVMDYTLWVIRYGLYNVVHTAMSFLNILCRIKKLRNNIKDFFLVFFLNNEQRILKNLKIHTLSKIDIQWRALNYFKYSIYN
jgi:hypothetical protein